MGHIQVAAQDYGLLFIQGHQVTTEIVLPLHAVVQTFQSVLTVRRVAANEVEVGVFQRDESSLVVVFVDTHAILYGERGMLGVDGCTRVSFLVGIVPVTLVTEEGHVELTCLHLGLLQAEEVGIQGVEGLFEILTCYGAQAVNVPTDEFHRPIAILRPFTI